MFKQPLKQLMTYFNKHHINARYDETNEIITLEFAHKPEYTEHAIEYISCVVTAYDYGRRLSVVLTQHLDKELFPHAKEDGCEMRTSHRADGEGYLDDFAMKIKQYILASEMHLNVIQTLKN